jgi:hypothetical protein
MALAHVCSACGEPWPPGVWLREGSMCKACRTEIEVTQASAWAVRACAECGLKFKPRQTTAVYCSAACKQRAYRSRLRAVILG